MAYDTALYPLDLDLDVEALERALAPTPRERLRRGLSRLGAALRRRATDVTIVTVLLIVAGVVHIRGMYMSPARFDDEGTYTAYAWAVQFTHRLGHYTYWYAHPPLGWLQMALWNWTTGAFNHAPYAVAAERQFMVICKLVSVALLYGLALRLRFTRVFAVGAVLLFALSPLAVYFTRTALLDNIVTPWLLAAFYLAASRRRSLGAAAGSAACFAAAVLSKETALLFLPALLILFWQCGDRRNRRFSWTVFVPTLTLLLVLYPAYALIKNELFTGPNHVSLQYAVMWQLFDRQGSGSIFDPKSTAHTVVRTWLLLDPWMPKLALAALVPGLIARRTRAVAVAFAVQVIELLRNGYLPYPFVVAMIPFAALTATGVLDVAWQAARIRLPAWWSSRPKLAWLTADRSRNRSVLASGPGLVRRAASALRRRLGWRARSIPGVVRVPAAVTMRAGVVAVVVWFVLGVNTPWRSSIADLWHHDRDAGAAAALSWMESNVRTDQRVVVDDSFWVDLVRHGYARDRTIWFTKLDVDKDVKLPATPAWKAIDYVVLTYQDQLAVHLNADQTPSRQTLSQFPTLGRAIKNGQIVAQFGSDGDRVTVWRVQGYLMNRQSTASPGSGTR